MLRLVVENIDICRISKVLGRHSLKSSITKSEIVIEADEIPEDVVDMIFEGATILGAQNYGNDCLEANHNVEAKSEEDDATTPLNVSEEESESAISKADESTAVSVAQESELIDTSKTEPQYYTFAEMPATYMEQFCENYTQFTISRVEEGVLEEEATDIEALVNKTVASKDDEEYSLDDYGIEPGSQSNKIPKSEMVYRGEVYQWGSIKDDEDAERKIKECVIILQNDYQNSVSDDTIALFCTSHYEERSPISFSFQFTQGTMIDHSAKRLDLFDHCNFFVGRIKGISRKQLGEYLGTMNDVFMNTLQPTVDFCLGLKRSRTVNWAQLRILSTINMEELFRISESKVSDVGKVEQYMELFGFDMSCNGSEYVKDAILIASRLSDYRLEILAETIAEQQEVDANEVLRLIVARIKENFQFKRSPAISFIRLIDCFLKKG